MDVVILISLEYLIKKLFNKDIYYDKENSNILASQRVQYIYTKWRQFTKRKKFTSRRDYGIKVSVEEQGI